MSRPHVPVHGPRAPIATDLESQTQPAEPPPALHPPTGFLESADRLGIRFEPGDLDRLGRFLALLLETNRAFNLTAIRDPDQAWLRHVLDALTLLPMLAELEPESGLIDVGSGGGLPGLPLAIVMPRIRVTLLEATGKKARFLECTARDLALDNVRVIHDRAERAGRDPALRGSFHVVTARAVGRIAVAAELCVPLARADGRVLLIKGRQADEELAQAAGALRLLRARHAGTLDTPTGRIVVVERVGPTPERFPRRDGEPRRSPLGVAP